MLNSRKSATSLSDDGPLYHSRHDRRLAANRALVFLSLFFVPGVAQAILLTVVPLEALKLLGSARAVTLVYVAAGLVAVIGRFSIPYLVRLIRRRFVFTLGTLYLAISSSCSLLVRCRR